MYLQLDKSETLRTSWDLSPVEFIKFDHPMRETFTNPKNSVLLRNPMMCRYFSKQESNLIFPELSELSDSSKFANHDEPKYFVFVYKRKVVVGDSESRTYVNEFNSYSEMNSILKLYFPMLDGNEIEKALNVFNQYEVSESHYDKIL
jgi:hypothetical protein